MFCCKPKREAKQRHKLVSFSSFGCCIHIQSTKEVLLCFRFDLFKYSSVGLLLTSEEQQQNIYKEQVSS